MILIIQGCSRQFSPPADPNVHLPLGLEEGRRRVLHANPRPGGQHRGPGHQAWHSLLHSQPPHTRGENVSTNKGRLSDVIQIVINHFQNDPGLKKIQHEVSLLLFRYLKNKFLSSEEASKTMSLLLRLVADLHVCLSIHFHGRPERGPGFCHATETWKMEQLAISPL